MLNLNNHYTYLKKELLWRFINFLYRDGKRSAINRIPYEMISTTENSRRCCVYKDREMIKFRLLAQMGYRFTDDFDESYTLQEYYDRTDKTKAADLPVLTVIKAACSSCRKSQYHVTELCKGCLARPCQSLCPRDAMTMKSGRAVIDLDKCINCGKCKTSCPYGAIVYTPVPCEEVCPVGAIEQNDGSSIAISNEKCISCGKCTRSCPFGAIVERSHILPLVKSLKEKDDMTLLLAPSIVNQLPGTMSQIKSALSDLGFTAIYELAESAQIVAESESDELLERKSEGHSFMTTSCCPAYMETIEKYIPELKPFVSHTDSPMVTGGKIIKEENRHKKTVFAGPCMAKKVEAFNSEYIDYVINFEELGALLMSREIEINDYPHKEEECDLTVGLGFATSGGVAKAVEHYSSEPIRSVSIDGITGKSMNLLRSFLKRAPGGDLVEVMACEGGCEKGPCTLC